jgi:hypothetical protein
MYLARSPLELTYPNPMFFVLRIFGLLIAHFLKIVKQSWDKPVGRQSGSVSILLAKFKRLRYDLKQWSKSLSNIKLLIDNCNKLIPYLDTVEEFRPLYNPKWNLRSLVKVKLGNLLKQQTQY